MEQNKILKAIIEHWQDIGIFLTGIWGLVFAGFKVYKYAFLPVKEWIKKINEAVEQSKYNGGHTMRDMVKQIRDIIDILVKKIDILSMNQDAYFELSDVAMFENDTTGKCVRVNAAICNLFGTTPNKMLGYGWANFIKNSDDEKEFYEHAIKTDNEINRDYEIYYGGDKTKAFPATYVVFIKRNESGDILTIRGKVFKHKI